MDRRSLIIIAAGLALAPTAALAEYPERPISLIVPYSAGGGADGAARILAQRLSEALGQQVLVENRPGAGGMIGARSVVDAEPDGYTVLYDASAIVTNQVLQASSADMMDDLVPVSLVVAAPNILVTATASPFQTLEAFVDYAKANPDEVTFASAGAGTASHLAGERFNSATGLEVVHVPYPGGGPALNDVIGQQISVYFANTASASGHVAGGTLRALAIGSAERSPLMPEVPTLIESGFEGFETQEWNGVFVPTGTDEAIVERLLREVQAAVSDEATRARFEALGLVPIGNSPEEFRTFLAEELDRTTEIVETRAITLD